MNGSSVNEWLWTTALVDFAKWMARRVSLDVPCCSPEINFQSRGQRDCVKQALRPTAGFSDPCEPAVSGVVTFALSSFPPLRFDGVVFFGTNSATPLAAAAPVLVHGAGVHVHVTMPVA